VVTAELVEELPDWKLDSTFQHRVNNVCTKLLRKGIRPTYQRVKANMGESPARLLRAALQTWTAKVLPDLYVAPKVEWADRPKAISPRVAELFEEMWLQAVSAAQVHYELGDDSSARLTHRELIDTVCHELRRINSRVSDVATASQRLDQNLVAHNDAMRNVGRDVHDSLQTLQLEVTAVQELKRKLEQTLAVIQRESARQSETLSQHLETCREVQRLEVARAARIRRMAARLTSAGGGQDRRRSPKRVSRTE
jgi:hypothetical protein